MPSGPECAPLCHGISFGDWLTICSRHVAPTVCHVRFKQFNGVGSVAEDDKPGKSDRESRFDRDMLKGEFWVSNKKT